MGQKSMPVRLNDEIRQTFSNESLRNFPEKPATGFPIHGIEEAESSGVKIYHSGTRQGPSGETVSSGGRVLAVTALGRDRGEARSKAYGAISKVRFEGMHYRRDIGEGVR